jgi:hypothetical protein
MNLETVSLPLAANQQAVIEAGGRRVYVLSAPYMVAEVALTDGSGGSSGFMRNVTEGAYANVPFSALRVTNGSTAQTVKLLIASGDAGSNALPGIVRVVDQSAEKTLAQTQFYTYIQRAATAAKVSMAGIIAGAGKSVAIKAMTCRLAAAGQVGFYASTGSPTDTPGGPSTMLGKLLSSAAVADARAWSGLAAGAAPTVGELPGRTYRGGVELPANTPFTVALTTPFIIGPGLGLFAVGGLVNTEVGVTFDFEEFS